jgi:Rv2258c-like winged HTH domain
MDEAKLHEFMGKFVTDMGGAFMMGMVLVGDELGLYRAMADHQPVTAEALASTCGCHPRLVREWLNANAAAGYVESANGAYRLPPEQAMALANEQSPVFVAPGTNVVASCFLDLDKLLKAFRGDGALPWGEHHQRMFHGVEKFFRPGYRAHLTTAWLPALDGVVASSRPAPRLRMSAAATGRRRSSWPRPIRTRASSVSTSTVRPSRWPASAPRKPG